MTRLALACLALIILCSVPLAAADGDAPLADAGLDQTVTQGTTVHLDGGGSHAPDGTIQSFDWVVVAPSGTTIDTSNPGARTTSFEATELGTYEVTLTVTDDEGRDASDTLFVSVETGAPPSVSVDGPEELVVGESGTFVPTIDAGDAPLDRATWTVRGDTVAVHDHGDIHQAYERQFDTLGSHDVKIRVVDAAGQVATAIVSVDVVQPADQQQPSQPGWYDGRSESDDPVIDGPQEVIEEEPLTATYAIDSDAAGAIDSTTWRVDGEPVSTGDVFEATWEPGYHQLSALVEYRDGSKRVVTFAGGDREVVAKPPVDLSLEGVDGYNGTVTGAVVAEDELDTLRSVEVYVDGRLVERVTLQGVGRHEFEFADDRVEDHEEVVVEAVATDNYEHEVRVSDPVAVVGIPELVSVEILNDPVDSYHERIDSERYTAKVEVVVDLNQYPVEGVEMEYFPRSGDMKLLNESMYVENEQMITKYYVSFVKPSIYVTVLNLEIVDRKQDIDLDRSEKDLVVSESDPEPRLQIHVDDNLGPNERRIQMDAGESFDPDYSNLSFSWSPDLAERSETWTGSTKNINSPVTLEIADEYGQETRVERVLTKYYSPTLDDYWLVNDTYTPRERVEIVFRTERHVMDSEQFYPADISFELVNAEGEVQASRDEAEQESRWVGSVTMPVQSYLSGDHPVLRVYNTENPNQTIREYRLPEPDFDLRDEFYLNVEVAEMDYLIEREVYDVVTTRSSTVRDLTLDEGYHLHSINEEYEYTIEEYYEIDAEYDTETVEFETEVQRQFFLDGASSGWGTAGERTETETKSSVSYEWRSSITRSEYTGSSRTRTIRSAKYRTEYEYRSQYGGTYWSTHAFSRYDVRTGSTRRVKVRDAITRTEYRHRVVEYRTVENVYYIAEKTELVQPRESGWREYETTKDEERMKLLTQGDQLRVGGVTEIPEWELRKLTDTEYESVEEVEEEDEVVETTAVVTGDIAHETIHRSELIVEIIDSFRKDKLYSEYKTKEEVLNEVLVEEAEEDPCVDQDVECSIEQ